MNELLVVVGNVSSGKDTLCDALAIKLGCKVFSSDAIRTELSGQPGGKSKGIGRNGKFFDTFATLRTRVENELSAGRKVIANSTGMSEDFRKMVEELRSKHSSQVIRLSCSYDTWKNRELIRSDRWTIDEKGNKVPFQMPERAFYDSSKYSLKEEPNLFVNTDNLSPQEILDTVCKHLGV